MKKAIPFDVEIAQIYDETRLIDAKACQDCFRDGLKGFLKNESINVADIGCGTGRILNCLIPDFFQKKQVVGVDVSSAMICAAKKKPALRGLKLCNVSALDFAQRSSNQKKFDIVICHWLFHCLPDWKDVFRACIGLVKKNGVIIWLEEDGDLYQVLDGMPVSQPNQTSKLLEQIFSLYFELANNELKKIGLSPIKPASRVGAAVRCTDDLAKELSDQGWQVQKDFETQYWNKEVTVNWIIQTVFKHRAFTNLREIPDAVNMRVIDVLLKRISNGALPEGNALLQLRFSATPVTATCKIKNGVLSNNEKGML